MTRTDTRRYIFVCYTSLMQFIKKNLLRIIPVLVIFVLLGIIWYFHDKTDYEFSKLLLTHQKGVKSTTSSPLSQIHHVFVIVEENKDWKTIYNNSQAPFINSILLKQAYATNYHNVLPSMGPLHPSGPNYILLEAGQLAFADHTFTSDDPPSVANSTSSMLHLSKLLDKRHLTWKVYQEDISGNDCPIHAVRNYVPKHNPFVYFQNVSGNPPSTTNAYCQEHIRPMNELPDDLKTGNIPNYVFITPNVQNDMHNGTIAEGDTWLSHIASIITNSSVFKKDGVLFITWDEGSGSDTNNPIGMIIESPFVKKGYTNSLDYSHASYVKTVEEIFNLSPLLGFAADKQTKDLSDFFNIGKQK